MECGRRHGRLPEEWSSLPDVGSITAVSYTEDLFCFDICFFNYSDGQLVDFSREQAPTRLKSDQGLQPRAKWAEKEISFWALGGTATGSSTSRLFSC